MLIIREAVRAKKNKEYRDLSSKAGIYIELISGCK